MEPKGYELLKIETKITVLEKELSALFADFKKTEFPEEHITIAENEVFQKLEKMHLCYLNLLDTYREYTKNLKNNI